MPRVNGAEIRCRGPVRQASFRLCGPASRRPAPCPRRAGCPMPDRGFCAGLLWAETSVSYRNPERIFTGRVWDTPEQVRPAACSVRVGGSAKWRRGAEPAGVHDAARALVERAAGCVDDGPARRRGSCPRTLGRQITYAAIPARCPGPVRQAGLRPGDRSAGNGVHRGADRTSACRAVAGRGSTRRVAPSPTTPGCPHELCDLPVASLLVIQATMINCPNLAGCRRVNRRHPAHGEARGVKGGDPKEALAGRHRRSGS
jgi:hypothetical protein